MNIRKIKTDEVLCEAKVDSGKGCFNVQVLVEWNGFKVESEWIPTTDLSVKNLIETLVDAQKSAMYSLNQLILARAKLLSSLSLGD